MSVLALDMQGIQLLLDLEWGDNVSCQWGDRISCQWWNTFDDLYLQLNVLRIHVYIFDSYELIYQNIVVVEMPSRSVPSKIVQSCLEISIVIVSGSASRKSSFGLGFIPDS